MCAGSASAKDGLKSAQAGRDEPMEETKGSDRAFVDGRPEQGPAGKPAWRETTAEKEGGGKERRGEHPQDAQIGSGNPERRQAWQAGRQLNCGGGKRTAGGKRKGRYPQEGPEGSDPSQEIKRQPGGEEPHTAKHLDEEKVLAKGRHVVRRRLTRALGMKLLDIDSSRSHSKRCGVTGQDRTSLEEGFP